MVDILLVDAVIQRMTSFGAWRTKGLRIEVLWAMQNLTQCLRFQYQMSVRTSHNQVVRRCFIRLFVRNASVAIDNIQIPMFINTPGRIDLGVSCDKTSFPIICTVNLRFCLNAVYKCAKTWPFWGQVAEVDHTAIGTVGGKK